MDFLIVLTVMAAVFGVCYLVDKGFTKLMRSQPEHLSGLSVRPSKHYGSMGMVIGLLGVAGLLTGITNGSIPMMVGSATLVLAGGGLAVYYISTGIFYDQDTFLSASLGKKQRTYRYEEILHQKLYAVQGGHYIVELYMADGSAVMVQTQMDGYREFLNHAARQWRLGKENIAPPDPDQFRWFPSEEEV